MGDLISIYGLWFLLSFFPLPTDDSIIDSTQTYTYEIMVDDLQELQHVYPTILSYHSIGKSHYNRDILAVRLGKGPNPIIITGSHHAREWMSTMVVMKMMEEYAKSYSQNTVIGTFKASDILEDSTIWFIPMVNPDGVTLQQKGLSAFPASVHAALLEMNEGSDDFTRWKANAIGIDLNRQYPANWDDPSDVTDPSWMDYKGESPFQALEVQAVRDFTEKIKPQTAVDYHTSGRILYWYFYNENFERDLELATEFQDKTGYNMIDPSVEPTGRGYTDWFIQEFGLPGFTPEIGEYIEGEHVPLEDFQEDWERNKEVGLWLAAESDDFQREETVPFNEKIRITQPEQLYSKPSFLTMEHATLTPQIIQAYEKSGNWYHVYTYLGEKWIHIPNRLKHFPDRTFVDVFKKLFLH